MERERGKKGGPQPKVFPIYCSPPPLLEHSVQLTYTGSLQKTYWMGKEGDREWEGGGGVREAASSAGGWGLDTLETAFTTDGERNSRSSRM